MSEWARRVAEHPRFGQVVTVAIVVAGVVVGLQTDAGLVARYGVLLDAVDGLILAIFAVEDTCELAAFGWRCFSAPWIVFDIGILTVAVLPFDARYVAVLRLARLLRFLRLVRALP